jgi:exopolyphosphatase/guanosine-5'-triphosphate,3'-diphosphate pyrophosphatase
MERVLGVLSDYRTILLEHNVNRVVVAATSAVRDAVNRDAFSRLVLEHTGFSLEVLDGEEEARWAFRGATSSFPELQHAMVIDIGGGSTEITSGSPAGITEATSLDIGAVRLTERFLKHTPPWTAEVKEMESWLQGHLAGLPRPPGEIQLIGVAGTVTSLATLDLGLRAFDRAAVTRHVLLLSRIDALYRELCGKSPEEISALSQVMKGREDIITAGTAILRGVMMRLGVTSVHVSERGIRYGLALRELTGRS